MANYAVVHGNKVINVIVADTKEIAETVTNNICIEITNDIKCGIGYTWDGTQFIGPEPIIIEGETAPPAIEG